MIRSENVKVIALSAKENCQAIRMKKERIHFDNYASLPGCYQLLLESLFYLKILLRC